MDRNRLLAIESATGEILWKKPTGGRVDSPPTVVGSVLYFGAADGTVTCLEAAGGEMIWRRRVAPTAEKLVCDGRVESVWPVHGSVTWNDGLVYAVAGRNMLVDGGLMMVALDPRTGEPKHAVPHALSHETRGFNTTPSKTDILAVSGDRLFMRSLVLDGSLQGIEPVPHV